MKIVFSVIVACNTGLSSNQNKLLVAFMCMMARIEDAFDEVKCLVLVHITMVEIDNPVSIEKEGLGGQHNLPVLGVSSHLGIHRNHSLLLSQCAQYF